MSKLIDDKLCQYFKPEKIEEAFWRYKEAKYDVFTKEIRIQMGADGISYKTFEKELSRRCQFISQKVIQGKYLFYPFREFNVSKPSSGQERVLAIATIRDVLVQKILYELLYEEVEKLFKATSQLDRVSCAYRKGKSAPSAARLIHSYIQSGFQFSLDADIVKFFDVIAHERLISIIEDLFGHESRVSTLIRRFIKTIGIPYRDEQNERRNIQIFHHYKPPQKVRLQGIPQGGVLSGMLANLYLHEFDRWILEDLAQEIPLRYVRYADDFVVLLKTKDDLPAIHRRVEEKLAQIKLQLHPILDNLEKSKTKYVDISKKPLVFVGFELGLTDIKISPNNIQQFQNKISQKLKKEKSYKFPDNPRERFVLLVRKVINKKIQGRPEKLCPICESLLEKNNRNWVGFFSVVTDTQQFHDLDKWIRVQLCQYFYKTYQIRLKRRDFREAGLASIIQEYYKNHKLKLCFCTPLNFKYILYWVFLTRQFDFLKEAITAHLRVEILKK